MTRLATTMLPLRTLLVSMLCAGAAVLSACGGGERADTTSAPAAMSEPAFNVVVRNDDPGLRTSGRFEAKDGYLSSSRQVLRGAGADAVARFQIAPPRPGFYEIFAWWPQAVADAGEATLIVRHAGGETALTVDQRRFGGQWNSLGVFELPAGGAEMLWRTKGAAPVLVDALRYTYLGAKRPPLMVATDKMSAGLKDHAFEGRVEAHSGVAPYTFRIVSGKLPEGVSLDESTGEFSGSPALPGSYDFSVQVTDARSQQASRDLTIEVEESVDLEPRTTPSTAEIGAARRSLRTRAQAAAANTSSSSVSGLLSTIAAMPAGEWHKVNLNLYSDVWAPASLRPLYGSGNPTPSKILAAWSSFTWDSNRNMLILYGGGHANYRGNDVYVWRASTQMWERGALPSEMVQDALGNWNAVDGADFAPASAHTYDNALFLPTLDRMLMVGGAADANGAHYLRQDSPTTSRKTGAYLFNPALAHPDRVGGSTGSHVKRVAPYPEIVGGNMWSNRDMYLNSLTTPPKEAFVNGCTGSATELGKDVAFIRTTSALYKYTIHDLANPTADTWERVGVNYYGPGTKAVCSYDAGRRVFLRTGSQATPFVYWNLATAGPNNRDVNVVPTDATGEFASLLSSNAITISSCGVDFDPVRQDHKLWCGDGRVWSLKAPLTLGGSGWTITRQPTPAQAVPSAAHVGSGILGKWKYIASLDVFMGVQDSVQGNVWIYKPVGWQMPDGGSPNTPPTVSLTGPANGATFTEGSPVQITASAADSDGSISRVEFFQGGTKIGEDESAPYSFQWNGAAAGTYSLSVRATDNLGAIANAGPVSVTVTPEAPQNQPPWVQITAPSANSVYPAGEPILLSATASDTDGVVTKVEFFRGSSKIGEVTTAPFSLTWNGAPIGSSSLTAVATDDDGAQFTSAAVSIEVRGEGGVPTTVILQRGSGGYAGAAETYLSTYHKTTAFGGAVTLQDQSANYSMLTRFAIFQSEGGPVPDGATIELARLSFYKFSAYDMSYGVHRMLKPWTEAAATWSASLAGVPWAVAGANGAGSDYAVAPDATTAVGFSAGWLNFDMTAAVQQLSTSMPVVNHGWRLRGISGNVTNIKKFHTSEHEADPSLRPKLEIRYNF
jgi:hypothetical protein